MAYWLLKTEPSEFSWDDLVAKKRAVWDGVSNPMALKHMRSAKKGDVVVIYHTGDERQAVGIAEIVAAPYGDPVVFDVAPKKKLVAPVPLDALKKSAAFKDSPLVRIGRLSVVPLERAQFDALVALSKV
jgi:predicted RNA-binding protein with PUA-like domain